MQTAVRKICPSCGHADLATATLCNNCGKELYPSCYKMAHDGKRFGITLNGKLIYNDLELAKAQRLVMILNGSERDQVA